MLLKKHTINSLFKRVLRSYTKKNPYETLGISRNSSKKEIKKAFINLTKLYHPDKNPDSKEKYTEINEAYQTLSNESKRRTFEEKDEEEEEPIDINMKGNFKGFQYDDYGADWEFEEGENHFESVFRDYDDFFKFPESTYKQQKPVKGTNIDVHINLSFPEAVNGSVKEILFWKRDVCTICEGSKSKPGVLPIKCKSCDCTGSKHVHDGNTTIKTECRNCGGKGFLIKEKCEGCQGSGVEFIKHIERVVIPRGVKDGFEIKLSEQGNKGDFGGKRGDICIFLHLIKDDYFKIDGYDLHIEKKISLSKSILGGIEEVETLEGKQEVKVPKHTGGNSAVCLENQGLKGLHDQSMRGDLYVWFRVELPEKVNAEQMEILKKLKGLELKMQGE